MRRGFAIGLVLLCAGVHAEFEAGFGVRDITPETGEVMWGYTSRTAPAEGALDPLHARAAVFRAADETVAVVTLDLGRPPLPDVCNRIRERVKPLGVDYVLFSASHTHQAPSVDVDAPYISAIENKIGNAIEEAVKNLAPARIGVGRTEIDIAHNRRLVLDDGSVRMLWRNEDKIPTAPVDKEAGVIRVDGPDGNVRAVIVHYACHPVVLGMDNTQYSADWVGAMAAAVTEATGAPTLFLNGGCGDINPYLDKTPLNEGGVQAMRGVGKEVGEAVLASLDQIETETANDPTVKHREDWIEVGLRWDKSDPANEKLLRSIYGDLYDVYIEPLPQNLTIPLATLVLNDSIAFLGMPGEIFVQYQLDLKARSLVKNSFLVGYANEYHAYFPTIQAAGEGGYGGSVQTYVGVGAADKLLTRGLINIGEMTGKIHDPLQLSDFMMKDATAEEAKTHAPNNSEQ